METLTPLQGGKVPQTFEELWSGFDPRAEPLETETVKAWEEDGVVLRIVRYRIGIFKGQKALMAAIYGYPKGGTKLPGLVQIHGGGQYADYRAVLTNAKRGYATLSIAWAGRINAPGYEVNPDVVKLFWDNRTGDPDYKLTTDWGALDAYHAPCRNEKNNNFYALAPAVWTLDSVESPRNSSWFLCVLGARRALTFLEQQPEVNPQKLGVYGHSMGGKLTVMTSFDSRVKAAAPSCGGISDRYSDNAIYRSAIGDDQYLNRISCPIIFLSPSNDFHGRINDLQKATGEIKSSDWRLSCSPHHNHQDTPEYQVTGLLWFDQYLKETFTFPETPKSSLELKTPNGAELFTVWPDESKPIQFVDIYYTQQGQNEGEKDDRENTMNRFWHYAHATQNGKGWSAELPLLTTDKPLWVYANVGYPLDQPVAGAGYYYALYTAKSFNLSSGMHIATSEQLKEAGIKATLKPSLVIEAFENNWQKEWYSYNPSESRDFRTHKLYDDQWKAPSKVAKLSIEILSTQDNFLQIALDDYASTVKVKGKPGWQEIEFDKSDFRLKPGNSKDENLQALPEWIPFKESVIGPGTSQWNGEFPLFKNFKWKVK